MLTEAFIPSSEMARAHGIQGINVADLHQINFSNILNDESTTYLSLNHEKEKEKKANGKIYAINFYSVLLTQKSNSK